MNKETKDELWRAFIELQAAAATVDAYRQAAEEEEEAEQQKLTKACNKLNSAIGMVREAYDMIDEM